MGSEAPRTELREGERTAGGYYASRIETLSYMRLFKCKHFAASIIAWHL
jgi:hypothetical protein